MNQKKCMFIGLPCSGKSSFIGSLWHLVESEEINCHYQISTLPTDREYLNMLRDSFLNCNEQERTKTDFVQNISLNIKDSISDNSLEFVFPDISGETFKNQFAFRKFSRDYFEKITSTNSIMLFINPDNLIQPVLIPDVDCAMPEENQEDPAENVIYPSQVWSPNKVQTQVILVDLLQFIEDKISSPICISILISAWDVVESAAQLTKSNPTPTDYLKKELPLFYQYLSANKNLFLFKTFGVSAQGGDYSLQNVKKELLSKISPSERIKVQFDENFSSDLTIPIKWLINAE